MEVHGILKPSKHLDTLYLRTKQQVEGRTNEFLVDANLE